MRVGPVDALERTNLVARDVSWVAPVPPREPLRAAVRIRYRHPEAPARLVPREGGRVEVHFDAPQSVRAAYTSKELADHARRAGFAAFEVERCWPCRLRLVERTDDARHG